MSTRSTRDQLRDELREGLAELVDQARHLHDEIATWWARRALVRRRKGRELHELPDSLLPTLRETARLRARPATTAGYVMVTVAAATALLTAPAAAAWRPWPLLEQALGQPITSDHPVSAWLIEQASTTPLVGGLLWFVSYASWLGATRDLVLFARRGRRIWFTRVWFGLLTLGIAALTYQQLEDLGGPIHPLAAAGAVIAAWRALTWATARHARAVNTLNEINARREVAKLEAAARAGDEPPLADTGAQPQAITIPT